VTAAKRLGKGQTTISDWKAKRTARERIEIKEDAVRAKIRTYLLQPERPAFREGVEYAVGEVRRLLDDVERRAVAGRARPRSAGKGRPGPTDDKASG